MDSSITPLWNGLFPIAGYLISFYYKCFIDIPAVNENSADPEQMICCAADLSLHCLPITFLWVSRQKMRNCANRLCRFT